MSDEPPVRPRIELEAAFSPRLEPLPPVPVAAAPEPVRTWPLLAGGAGVLAGGFAVLQAANFIAAQFDRAPWLGWLTLAVALGGFGLIGAGIWRELRGLLALRRADRLRAALAGEDAAAARAAARAMLAVVPDAALAAAIDAAPDAASIRALLRAGPGAVLRARSEALGRTAAVQIFALTAATPSAALDGLLMGWRGVRLIREIAVAHGLRPGGLATWALLRRTALSAAGVAATGMATDTALRAVISSPLLAHVAGDAAAAGVAARRMLVLARAAAAACSPLPPE